MCWMCGSRTETRVAVSVQGSNSESAFRAIGAIDYTVIFVRNMNAMRSFYRGTLSFELSRELSPDWLEHKLGNNTLTLARPKIFPYDVPTPVGSASLQLAFKVPVPEVGNTPINLSRKVSIYCHSPPIETSATARFSFMIRMAMYWRFSQISDRLVFHHEKTRLLRDGLSVAPQGIPRRRGQLMQLCRKARLW